MRTPTRNKYHFSASAKDDVYICGYAKKYGSKSVSNISNATCKRCIKIYAELNRTEADNV